VLDQLVELWSLRSVFLEHELDDGEARIRYIVSIERQVQRLIYYVVFNFLKCLSIEGETSEDELIEKDAE